MQLQSGDKEHDFSLAPIQVSISVQLWRLPGCHEFLAALGRSSHFTTKPLHVLLVAFEAAELKDYYCSLVLCFMLSTTDVIFNFTVFLEKMLESVCGGALSVCETVGNGR